MGNATSYSLKDGTVYVEEKMEIVARDGGVYFIATMLNPFWMNMSMIFPVCPFSTASGLIIVKVRFPAISN